jgi:hypothetical protein
MVTKEPSSPFGTFSHIATLAGEGIQFYRLLSVCLLANGRRSRRGMRASLIAKHDSPSPQGEGEDFLLRVPSPSSLHQALGLSRRMWSRR